MQKNHFYAAEQCRISFQHAPRVEIRAITETHRLNFICVYKKKGKWPSIQNSVRLSTHLNKSVCIIRIFYPDYFKWNQRWLSMFKESTGAEIFTSLSECQIFQAKINMNDNKVIQLVVKDHDRYWIYFHVMCCVLSIKFFKFIQYWRLNTKVYIHFNIFKGIMYAVYM